MYYLTPTLSTLTNGELVKTWILIIVVFAGVFTWTIIISYLGYKYAIDRGELEPEDAEDEAVEEEDEEPETYTIQVNGEAREVTLDELKSGYMMGADYAPHGAEQKQLKNNNFFIFLIPMFMLLEPLGSYYFANRGLDAIIFDESTDGIILLFGAMTFILVHLYYSDFVKVCENIVIDEKFLTDKSEDSLQSKENPFFKTLLYIIQLFMF